MTAEAQRALAGEPAEGASAREMAEFFGRVSQARESGLYLDFDGTLAAFRLDPAKARPWAGVTGLLESIAATGRTRLAIVSGRPAAAVAAQLGMRQSPEIWGLHGAERRLASGEMEREALTAEQESGLAEARARVLALEIAAKPGVRLEHKWNAVAVHWRGLSPEAARQAQDQVLAGLGPLALGGTPGSLSLLRFDGGLEVRAGMNKGDAVRRLLKQMGPDAPVAYLGDDVTDEDAFEALAGRGLSVLVRRQWRPTAAGQWLRPPGELRGFLERWRRALGAGPWAGC